MKTFTDVLGRLYSHHSDHKAIWIAIYLAVSLVHLASILTLAVENHGVIVLHAFGLLGGGVVLGYVLRAILTGVRRSSLPEAAKDVIMAVPALFALQMIITVLVSLFIIASGDIENAFSYAASFRGQVHSRPGMMMVSAGVAAGHYAGQPGRDSSEDSAV